LKPMCRLGVGIGVVLLLYGCIESYGSVSTENIRTPAATSSRAVHFIFSSELEKDSPANHWLYFSATGKEDFSSQGTLAVEYQVLQELLGGLFHATIAPEVPERGIYIKVETNKKLGSLSAQAFCLLHFATLTMMPCYTETYGVLARFEVMRDGAPQKSYEYALAPKKLMWLGVLPVVWLNSILPSYRDAFRAVVYRFVNDARADGLL
jgi:hypothetical protein